MAKFYIESGEFRAVVQADTVHHASLWAMHLAMESTVSLDDLAVSDEQLEDLQFADSVATLGPVMYASEIGFGRYERGSFATLDIMTEWNQLTMVVADLSKLIAQH